MRTVKTLRFAKPISGKSPPLKKLIPVVRRWQKIIIDYSNKHPKDAGYWYGERTNVSLLAGAAWKSGCVALEEYATGKNKDGEEKGGRCDLYIQLSKRNNLQIEAKHWWIFRQTKTELHKLKPKTSKKLNASYREKIKKAFEACEKDAKSNTETQMNVACVFFVVGFSDTENYIDNQRKFILDTVSRVVSTKNIFWAWCFPAKNRKLFYKHKNSKTSYWPGVIMGMKIV